MHHTAVHAYRYDVYTPTRLDSDGCVRCMIRLYLKFAQTLKPAKSQFTKIWDKSVVLEAFYQACRLNHLPYLVINKNLPFWNALTRKVIRFSTVVL